MAQEDYVVADQTGASFLVDLNNMLAAIVSNNSGATEPSTKYAYQWWADTTTGLLKIRNAANSAWVTVGTMASANLGLATLASPTFTGTPAAPTAASGAATTQLATTAFVTTSPAFAGTPTAPTAAANTNTTQLATTAFVIAQNIFYAASVATTSATSVVISTTIPAWVKRITLIFDGVSSSGTSNFLVQIGDSGGFETTGYTSESLAVATTTPSISTSTAGFSINTSNASNLVTGKMVVERMSVATNWIQTHTFRGDPAKVISGAGGKYLSAALDRVRITTVNGTDTFDAGTIHIIYE